MIQKIKKLALRFFLVTVPALLLSCIVIEISFRLFVPVSDQPVRYFNEETGLWQAKANQEGNFALGKWGEVYNEPFRLNNAGWNSAHDYTVEKPEGTLRIAVIGDSIVEGFRVDYRDTSTQVLEDTLNEISAQPIEVYNFGVTGAPLSQYLNIMRYVSATYEPDIYVVNLFYNDFDESFRQNVSQPEVMQLGLDENGDIYEIPAYDPQLPFWRELVISPAVVRYVRFNLGYSTPSELWTAIKYSWDRVRPSTEEDEADAVTPVFQFRTELISQLLYYVLPRMQNLADQSNSDIIFVMDSLRSDITSQQSMREVQGAVAFQYNLLVADVCEDLDIPLVDMTPHFFRDFQTYGQEFDFGADGHWNVHAHELVGRVLADRIIELGWLDTP